MKFLAFGEVMMRMTVPNYKMLEQSDSLEVSYSGTGLNILSGLAHNGLETHLLTMLPENSLGRAAKSYIRRLGVSDDQIIMTDKHKHMGSYLLEMGYGNRPSEVTYQNRSQSSFCRSKLTEEDLTNALKGIDLMHICGIALSTSEISRENALQLAKTAHEQGILVCFDFNYRLSLAKEEEHELLVNSYKSMLAYSDIVFGSEKDLLLLLKMEHPEGESSEDLYQKFLKNYQLKYFSGTHKTTEKNQNFLQGFLAFPEGLVTSQKREITSYDRIGTGDAYAAGILLGLTENWELQEIVEFAATNAQLAYTTYGDSPVLRRELIQAKMADENLDIIR
jgi:2-dehydro-3-deoxygluconokinase